MKVVRDAAWVAALFMLACADTGTTGGADAVAPTPDQRVAPRDSGPLDRGLGPDSTCAIATTAARRVPAAILIVLDRSSSMGTLVGGVSRWNAAQLAIVRAIDDRRFDDLLLGLMVYPLPKPVPGPACILGFPVACGVPALPQVAIRSTGTARSSAPAGVRRELRDWLAKGGPTFTLTDASPGYDALNGAIRALQTLTLPGSTRGKRVVIFITDGGFSCTSLSKPQRRSYKDRSNCPDWEDPNNVIALLKKARADTKAPVETFVVGVPGSDSNGGKQGLYDTPPYEMRLALSAYAAAGSPANIDPTCDGRTFTKTGAAPKKPCHFDMSKGTFTAAALARVIGAIRGKALGCVYELPRVAAGKVVDRKRVNVKVTREGKRTTIPRRKDPKDTCGTSPCWDYDKEGQVQLLGKACTDVKSGRDVKVEIEVGCQTVLK